MAPGANPVAFWQGESNTLDSAGVYHGTMLGGGGFAPGQVGQSFTFDGTNGWVVAWPSTNLQLLAGATLMAWVRLDRLPSEAGRFMYIVGKSQVGNDLDLQIETDNRARFYIGAGTRVSSTNQMQTGAWYHIAATYRPAQRIELFINGDRENSLDTGVVVASNANPFSIGDSTVFSGRYFQGGIDQVRLYDSALSASEIQTLYLAESGTLPPPRLDIRVSQVEICWETFTNAGYQLQYRSELTTNDWVPFYNGYWPGTGGVLCTNDAVFPGQGQRFYQVVVTNLVPATPAPNDL
jgi:hypothetical protein